MADFAVNYDGMDMGSAPNEALAVKPTTYRAFTNDGDFAGEVNMAYRGPVRVVDPATGDEVFSSADPDAAEKAFALVNGVSHSDGRKASWAVQIDNGNGWETAAMDNIDPKKQSLLGKLADVALPILGAIFLPGFGALAALGATGGAAAGAALGSIASSVGQGRSIEDAAKRALLSAATAGIASGVSGAIAGNAAGNAAAQAVAKGTMTASEAAAAGATASQLVSAGLTPAAAQAAIQAASVAPVVVQGIGAGAQALAGGANLGVNLAGNLAGSEALNTVEGGFFKKDPLPTQPEPTVTHQMVADELVLIPDATKNSILMAIEKGLTPAQAAGMFGITAAAAAAIGQAGASAGGAALATTPVETAGAFAEATPLANGTMAGNAAAGQIAANSGLSTAALGGVGGFTTTAEMMASANAAMLAGGSALTAWIAAHPLAAAQLGLAALGAVTGGGDVGANGLATGGGTPPALQQSALFKKALPAASGIFANLAPRDVSKSVTDWNKYGEGGEQSFFANVPVRANGVTPDPNLVVTPSNPSTGGGTSTGTGTTNTGTTNTGTTATGQTPTNLAVQNMAKYGQTPGVLDLRNQPTSVDNPYAGYATTRTPPTGAVALPTNSNARFVVQDPMTAAEAEKQARLSAGMASLPTSKDGAPDFAVKSTGTPPQPANPASAAATAPLSGDALTDSYRQKFAAQIQAEHGADAAASAERVKAFTDSMKPTTDGTMNQFQLDMAGLKEQPKAAPAGVDPLGYYYMSNAGMNNAEREKYNADLDKSTILNDEPRMSLIDSPEWLNQNFGVKMPVVETPQFKRGGTTSHAFAVKGAGDGREDKIDAKLSDGEYVIDAETVALLGNGSSKAGAAQLDKFRVNIRKHKGQKLASGKFSANAKSPEAYLAGGRR